MWILAADGAERAPGGGLRRGGQPDVESVGRTLMSEWCLGCSGRRPREYAARSARGAAVRVGETAGPAHLCTRGAVSRTWESRPNQGQNMKNKSS